MPLACGWYGAVFVLVIENRLQNSWKIFELKLVPWSECITSGDPKTLIQRSNSFDTIVSVSIDFSGIKQGNREKQSTTAKIYLYPLCSGNGPAMSMHIFCSGCDVSIFCFL